MRNCPFCGSENVGVKSEIRGYGQTWAAVFCNDCEARGPRIRNEELARAELEAIEEWEVMR